LTTVDESGKTILVIGLGNPILGDDGVGWRVAEAVAQSIGHQATSPDGGMGGLSIEVDCLAIGGLGLMERMIGYRRAILVDAINSHAHPSGTVSVFPIEALPNRAAGHLFSSHDTTLQNALALGRTMGADLPSEILIVAVEAENVYDFGEELSPAVSAAVPKATQAVLELLGPNP
jgi:hydrogenase maturation protease